MVKRVAICLRGAVSRIKGSVYYSSELYDKTKVRNLFYYGTGDEIKYVNLDVVYNSIKRHIIDVNQDIIFDFFIHCWDTDLESKMKQLYNPKKALFESNLPYADEIFEKLATPEQFSQASQFLSFKKVVELKEEYEKENEMKYDLVILYRPDVFLWKDIQLHHYNSVNIYVNNWSDSMGDFHFIMSSENSRYFKDIYGYINKSIPILVHVITKQYITGVLGKPLIMDNIQAGVHQEVLRKIKWSLYSNKSITENDLYTYGMTEEELKDYQSLDFA